MAKDRATIISERLSARAAQIQKRIKTANPIGLGREDITHAELQRRIRSDEATRDVMLERMGPDLLLDYLGDEPGTRTVEYEE